MKIQPLQLSDCSIEGSVSADLARYAAAPEKVGRYSKPMASLRRVA